MARGEVGLDEEDEKRRATVHDLAREAGVSLATVDRVLNGRPGVRPATAQKVEDAIAALDFRRDLSASLLARSRDLHLRFFIPDGANEFMDNLGAAIARRVRAAKAERLRIETTRLAALDAEGLAAALDGLTKKSCDCAVIVATDDAAVTRAVDAAARRGVQVMTLVSDLPGSSRRHFIGIDNVAAGRTAASLLGRFCAPGSKVGIVAGSLGLRDHAERLQGFLAVAKAEFPQLEIIGPFEGHDRNAETEALVRRLLAAEPGLAALYNLGAGNAGLMSALESSARAGRLRVIAHELTEPTRRGLVSGTIDVVLDQNPDAEIRAAIAAARALAHHGPSALEAGRIEIGIFLRDNLR
jgi:LacI family transcriptional regulator